MPYRSRPQWIAIALMFAAAPLLAAEPSVRTYDVRDLLIDVPDYGPDAIVIPKTPPAQRLDRVLSALQASVPGLGENAVKTLGGQLIVTADEDVHRQVAQVVAAARASRGTQVLLESRIIDVPNSIVGKLPEAMRTRVATALTTPNTAADLGPEDVKALLGAIEPASGVSTISAPRLTAFNGQRVFLTVADAAPKAADRAGIAFNAGASTDGEATSVAFTLTLKRRLASNALTTNFFDSMCTLPAGHSALYATADVGAPGHSILLLLKTTPLLRREVAEPKK